MMENATAPLVALFDVGKTNSKLSLIDADRGIEIWHERRTNQPASATYGRALDIESIGRWLIETLARAPNKERIQCIVPVAHGAAAVLIDGNGQVLAAPDYEDSCFESINAAYDEQRDAFEQTFSPKLPLGLNLGRQLFYLQHEQRELFERASTLLLYPQYWAWRLSAVAVSEVTSLGCHTDLWRPKSAIFSALAEHRGWARLFPPLRRASEKIGSIDPAVARQTGLSPACGIACGIHDSNASYLKFLIGREHTPFVAVSSGTWTIVMANDGDLSRLKERNDMLANVNALGRPVPTARFMGGREYETIAGGTDAPTLDGVAEIMSMGAMALPSFAPAGPFNGRVGCIDRAEHLSGTQRASLATLYSVLMTSLSIESLGENGEILIDGPLAANSVFGSVLAALTGRTVRRNFGEAGGARVALHLAGFKVKSEILSVARAAHMPELPAYEALWREKVLS